MLKKSIITIVALALLLPAANLLAEEMGPKQPQKKQPGTRIQKIEERLERIEKMLQNRGRTRQKALTGTKEQPAKRPQTKRAQPGRQNMEKWFDELEKAYDQKDMKKIGQLIKKSNKFREQMRKRRAEVRQERPRLREGFRGGSEQGKQLRERSGRDREWFGKRDFQGRRFCPRPYSDYGRERRGRE